MNFKEFFERPRARIIVISVAVFLLLIGTIVAIACFNMSKDNEGYIDDEEEDFVGAFAEKSTFISTTNQGSVQNNTLLIFESNGDGTCSIVGIADKSATKIIIPDESPSGDSVCAIADGAFNGCSKVENIVIPSSVKIIGSKVFSGCTSLSAFNVDTENTRFASSGGVLFSKDKTLLICYPASRVGKSYLLGTSVKEISPYAFESATYLQKILYEGSSSKYRAITIGAGNTVLSSISVTCNYAGAK